MNNLNYVDKAEKDVCAPFKDNCVEPVHDPSIGPYRGLFYSAIACIFFWIGTFSLIGWIR